MEFPTFFLYAILLGLLPAYIASKKGRSFVAWWIFGALLLIVALPAALIIKNDPAALEREKLREGNKKCPFCAEFIKAQATVCRYCGRDLPEDVKPDAPASNSEFEPSASFKRHDWRYTKVTPPDGDNESE